MRKTGNLALRIAGVIALAFLLVPSAFADWRHPDETYRWVARRDRVTYEGRIRDIERERGGYRIRLERNDTRFWIDNIEVSRAPRRLRVDDLRAGAFIRLGGYVNRYGNVDADYVEWLGGDRDRDRYERRDLAVLRGVVHRIDLRNDVLVVREERTNHVVAIDMTRVDRHRRGYDLDDLRRGDRVTLFGDWVRGDRFNAQRIESVR